MKLAVIDTASESRDTPKLIQAISTTIIACIQHIKNIIAYPHPYSAYLNRENQT